MGARMKGTGIPVSYQDWLDCLAELKIHRADETCLDRISGGTLVCSDQMRIKLEERIAETVSVMANRRIHGFVRRVNALLSCGETEELPRQFRRFSREIRECFFFRTVAFLSEETVQELESQLRIQVAALWEDMVSFLRRQLEEGDDGALEDSLFLIGRIVLFPERHRE